MAKLNPTDIFVGAEFMNQLERPEDLAHSVYTSEMRGSVVTARKIGSKHLVRARLLNIPRMQLLHAPPPLEPDEFNTNDITKKLRSRPDFKKILFQLKLADHQTGFYLFQSRSINPWCLPDELKARAFMHCLEHPEIPEGPYFVLRHEYANPDALVRLNMWAWIESAVTSESSRSQYRFAQTQRTLLLNSERVLYMQKYYRFANSWKPKIRCGCIAVDGIQDENQDDLLGKIQSQNTSQHVHRCARFECKKTQNPDSGSRVSTGMRRKFQVCRLCKEEKLRSRAFYCSPRCHYLDWPAHSVFHKVLRESANLDPIGHRPAFELRKV